MASFGGNVPLLVFSGVDGEQWWNDGRTYRSLRPHMQHLGGALRGEGEDPDTLSWPSKIGVNDGTSTVTMQNIPISLGNLRGQVWFEHGLFEHNLISGYFRPVNDHNLQCVHFFMLKNTGKFSGKLSGWTRGTVGLPTQQSICLDRYRTASIPTIANSCLIFIDYLNCWKPRTVTPKRKKNIINFTIATPKQIEK